MQTVGAVDYVLASSHYNYIHLLSVSNDKITMHAANMLIPSRPKKFEITGLTVGSVVGSWLISGPSYVGEAKLA